MKRTTFVFFATLALAGGVIDAGQGADPEQQAEFGEWSTPVNLGPLINSAGRDAGVSISRDGLTLYFSSARAGTAATDLLVSRRQSVAHPWEAPVPLAMLNTASGDSGPSLTRDNRLVLFSSNRPGGFGSLDLWVSARRHTQDDFGWEPPDILPLGVNGSGQEVEPNFVENPGGRPQLYFSSGPNPPGLDIYVTELNEDGTWSTPENLVVLNSAFEDAGSAIRFDGLEMIFASRRGGPDLDLYVTRRSHRADSWSLPERLPQSLNSTGSDFSPALSANGRTLYFASNRPDPDALGNFDLYASTRVRIR